MKKVFLIGIIMYAANVSAQKETAEKFASTITPKDLKAKLEVIADARMEGRETATEGQRKAATYIENYFKKLKLVPGDSGKYQMSFPVYQDSLTATTFTVDGKEFKLAENFSFVNNSYIAAKWKINDIVFANSSIQDSAHTFYDSMDVKGKWVMITASMAETTFPRQLMKKISPAIKHEAAGVLIVSEDFPVFSIPKKSRMYNQESKNKTPLLYISKEVAQAILKAPVTDTAAHKLYTTNIAINIAKTTTNLQSTNVIGILPGTDKKSEYIFITSHYDHLGKHDSVIYYGADDDGSGTTSVLQIANAFAAARDAGFTPKRTIVFMTVSGEEKGLWGSEYFSNHPTVPLDSVSVDLNIDMVGRIDPERNYGDSVNYVYTIGEDKLSSDLMPVSDSINNACCKLELDRKFNDPNDPNRFYYRSDHYNFASKGVPIIFYFNGTHADYHKPTDTVDKINFDVMAKRIKLIFYTAWEMANRDALLKRDIPLNQQ